jgi:UDP-N-acetylmuramoyl-tripeptide--D-alanyl-D-alanine ligase
MLIFVKNKWVQFLSWILGIRAKYVLQKFKPLVVGVTGSVGKSSTKEAIFSVLNRKYPVMRNEGNFNNELGVPLTIIQQNKPEGVGEWLKFIFTSYFTVQKIKEYPAYLVLELAADKKGDIKYLGMMVEPVIGVITNIGESHLEYFGNIKKTTIEKRALVELLPKEGRAVLNFDDKRVMSMANHTKAKIMTFGLKKGADISATNVLVDKKGTSFKLVYKGSVVPVRLNMIGYSFVRSALAATAVGLVAGMDLIDIIAGLQAWKPLPGRMCLVEGINDIVIIDDSYNASPDSMINSIESMRLMDISSRKVAILGSMWELGKATKSGHMDVGKRAGRFFDSLVCVEEFGDIIKQGALSVGMLPENIKVYKNTDQLLDDIKNILIKGDLVLVKGSQSKNRLERVVKKIMKKPGLAKKILVRQSSEWLKK